MSHKRKAFNFDLDNGKLEELYPSPSGSTTSYNNAWSKIKAFMEANGFEHSQYSGYESIHGMSYADAFSILEKLQATFPWFRECAQAATLTEIGASAMMSLSILTISMMRWNFQMSLNLMYLFNLR